MKLDLDPSLFDTIGAEGSPLSSEKREMITRGFMHKRQSFEEQEAMLDEMDENGQHLATRSQSPAERKGSRNITPYARFLAALHTCSVILRNSELVDDAPLKSAAYKQLIDWWSEALVGLILVVDLSEDQIDTSIHPALHDIAPEAIKYFVKVIVPLVGLAVIRESLGTPKLELLMDEHLEQSPHFAQRC